MTSKKLKIKKGDTVMVITGREKSKTGTLREVRRSDDTVIVDGLNMIKRHVRARGTESGMIIEKEAPIHISNVMLFCAACSKPVRVRTKILDDNKKVRVCAKCGESFDK